MSKRSAKAAAATVLAIVVVNLLLRVVPLPDVDLELPSVAIPGWVHTLVTIKNVAFGLLIALAAAGVVLREVAAHRRPEDR